MSTKEIRQKLHEYIDSAKDKDVKAIYKDVEQRINAKNHWDDKEFVAEMDRRSNEFETGKDKGTSWEEVQVKMNTILKSRKKK